MGDHDATFPSEAIGLPVRELLIEVVNGPDQGSSRHARDEAIVVGTAEGLGLQLSDRTVSRFHVEFVRDQDRVRLTDLGSTNGTLIGPVRVRDGSVTLGAGTTVQVGRTELRVSDGATVTLRAPPPVEIAGLVGTSEALGRTRESVAKLAQRDTPVLLLGESGTGKELLARALHALSPRADEPFVTVDCAALTPNLVQSTLFGHERGAFTGATQRHVGAFERANGGTLFLDEVGELPHDLQPALLGALERRQIQRVGGQEPIAVDVRVVSATHRDLRSEVNEGGFRLDLYYRLAVVLLQVPALRERREDIPLLVDRFLIEEGHDGAREELFPPEKLRELRAHRWPGNVRELRNVVAATVAMGEAQVLDGVHVPGTSGGDAQEDLDLPYKEARRVVTEHFEHRYLTHLLARSDGNVRQAARLARMDRTYLTELLKRHGLR